MVCTGTEFYFFPGSVILGSWGGWSWYYYLLVLKGEKGCSVRYNVRCSVVMMCMKVAQKHPNVIIYVCGLLNLKKKSYSH